MSKEELDNLVRISRLKAEPGSRGEFAGMLKSARTRLADAQNKSLDPDSQFDLAYGAAHRLALAALRHQGYRSENRITVFQTSFIRWLRIMLTCKFFLKPTTNETLQNRKAVWKLTKVFWPI
jgi:hypothetical protein